MSEPTVAIVGAAIYPFGRHEGVSGLAMGVEAARRALADAGVAWTDVEFAYGGSHDAGNADTMVADLGPTGIPARSRTTRPTGRCPRGTARSA